MRGTRSPTGYPKTNVASTRRSRCLWPTLAPPYNSRVTPARARDVPDPDHGRFMPLAGLDGSLLAAAIAALTTSALLPLVASLGSRVPAVFRVRVPRLIGLVGALLVTALGLLALADGPHTVLTWTPGFPSEPFTLMADLLAAPFLLVLGLVAAGAYATTDTHATDAGARARLALQSGFTLAMLAVIVAQHALLLLLAWEGMTLLSALLVAHDSRSGRARQATFTYLALSHAGTACLEIGRAHV